MDRNILKNPINLLIAITCFVVIFYFGIKIYKEVTQKSYKDQQIHCLELGSDYARKRCLQIIGSNVSGDKAVNPWIESIIESVRE